MDKLTGDTLKSMAVTSVGLPISKLAYEIQENVYNRPNDFRTISESLQNPDFLTAFTYPLTLMYAMRTFFSLAQIMNKGMGNSAEAKAMEVAVKLTPVVVMGLVLYHEVFSKPNYVDHPALDLLAGCVAGLTYIMTTDTKKDLKLALNKISSKIHKTKGGQEDLL